MYTKEWYRENYKKAKKSCAWYKVACSSQAARIKELEHRVRELEYKVKEMDE